jgi:hypothetical protein
MHDRLAFRPPPIAVGLFLGLALLGAVGLAVGASRAPERSWANVLLVSNYLMGLALGSLVLLALFHVTGARWGRPLRRVLEGLAITLPLGGLGLLAVLLLQPSLYAWFSAATPAAEADSPLYSIWLKLPFFIVRALVYLAIWLAFAGALVWTSRRQDQTGDRALTGTTNRLSAGFLVAFGVTCWLASSDWLMSLEPDWSSTMFGVYNFSGLFLSALAAVSLLAVWLRRVSPLRAVVTEHHLHDLGTLLFGFSSFWMYTWFCQYLLIWYTNHPEETRYFVRRTEGVWPAFLILDLVLNWGIPFCVLLFRRAKRNPAILAAVALIVLAGRWVDLAVMIFPSQGETLANPGMLEAAFGLGGIAVLTLTFFWALGTAPLLPVNDATLPPNTLRPESKEAYIPVA